MNRPTKLLAATLMTASIAWISGCEPQMNGGGGYHSTSSAQNVGSRSSDGTYGGTSQSVGRAGGTDNGGSSAPATPYKQTPAAGGTGTGATNNATVGPQNP